MESRQSNRVCSAYGNKWMRSYIFPAGKKWNDGQIKFKTSLKVVERMATLRSSRITTIRTSLVNSVELQLGYYPENCWRWTEKMEYIFEFGTSGRNCRIASNNFSQRSLADLFPYMQYVVLPNCEDNTLHFCSVLEPWQLVGQASMLAFHACGHRFKSHVGPQKKTL